MTRFHGVATKYLDHYLGWRLLDRYHDAVTGERFLFHALRQGYVNIKVEHSPHTPDMLAV